MIQHVIAAAVDHTSLDDRVVEARFAHDLFRCPLRLVIRGTALRPRAQEAHQHDLPDSGAPRSLDDIPRPCHVNALVTLLADLAIDTGAVRHCTTTLKRLRQLVHIIERPRHNLFTGARASTEPHDFMSFARQPRSQVTADETRSTRNCDSHNCLLFDETSSSSSGNAARISSTNRSACFRSGRMNGLLARWISLSRRSTV